MINKEYAIPEYATSNDIKRIRNFLKMTQKEFADFVKTSKRTIERWENTDEKIEGPIVLLLNMIENNMNYIKKLEIPEKKYPVRMFYMKKQIICTLIDVNDMTREIEIINYTDNIMFRAFGINEKPNYDDYQEFLKSRCFPETRDKLKLVLEDLGLPFYDPFMIVEKTKGKMAEDDFWIRIEGYDD